MADKKKPTGRGKGPIQGAGPWSRSRTVDEVSEVRCPEKDDEKKSFSLEEQKDAFPPLPKSGKSPASATNSSNEEKKVDESTNDKINDINTEKSDNEKSDNDTNDSLNELTNHTKNLTLQSSNENMVSPSNPIHDFPPKMSKEPVSLKRQKMLNLVPRAPAEDEVPAPSEPELAMATPPALEVPIYETPDTSPEKPSIVNISGSTLSPLAEEFVPRNVQQYSMNPSANDFVPAESLSDSLRQWNSHRNMNGNMIEEAEDTIFFFYQKINESPGLFDELMAIIVPSFTAYLKSNQCIIKIVNDLYDLSLNDRYFAYHAVKLLVHLMNVGTIENRSTEIRDRLLTLAQTESETLLIKLEGANIDCNDVVGFLYFLSELYIQFEVNGRLLLIGKMVVTILHKLLSAECITVKERLHNTICIIKLTGTFLDEDDRSLLDGIILEIEQLLNLDRINLDLYTIRNVENLIKVHKAKWGNQIRDNGSNSPLKVGYELNVVVPMFDQAQAVFYGPDGQIMPYEEQMFLESQAMGSGISSTEEQSEPSPCSMDGEMEEAYIEFLRTIPQAPPVIEQVPQMPQPMPTMGLNNVYPENNVPAVEESTDLPDQQDPPPQQ